MIESILGSKSKEQVLLYISAKGEAYASEIALFYDVSISPLQNQLNNLELGGILVSKNIGKTRIYMLNPRYAFLKELKALLDKAITFLSEEEQKRLFTGRKRPRRNKKVK